MQIPLPRAITRTLNQANLPSPGPASLFFTSFSLRQSKTQSHLSSFLLYLSLHIEAQFPSLHRRSRLVFRFIGPDEAQCRATTCVPELTSALLSAEYTIVGSALILLLLECSRKVVVQGGIPTARGIIQALNQAYLPFPFQSSSSFPPVRQDRVRNNHMCI